MQATKAAVPGWGGGLCWCKNEGRKDGIDERKGIGQQREAGDDCVE